MPKQNPTRRQSVARSEQRTARDRIRSWREVLSIKRHAQRMAAKKAAAVEERPRGVDRVPDGLRVTHPDPQWLHHHGEPVQKGLKWVKGEPYRNPNRDAKSAKSGRLRKDLQQ